MSSGSLGIGSTVWTFDPNRRVYDKTKRGGPIYREHFRPRTIVGETRVSWILDGWDAQKVNKKTLAGIFPTEQHVNDAAYMHDIRRVLIEALEDCRDVDALRRIEVILNEPKES